MTSRRPVLVVVVKIGDRTRNVKHFACRLLMTDPGDDGVCVSVFHNVAIKRLLFRFPFKKVNVLRNDEIDCNVSQMHYVKLSRYVSSALPYTLTKPKNQPSSIEINK